jgi:carboxypeptidase D
MPYFNRPDVKTALHAPMNSVWSECANRRVFTSPRGTGPEREGDLSADPIQKVLPQVIQATNRVLVANGDYVCLPQSITDFR